VSNEIQRMMPRHFRILELCLEGLPIKAVAEEVGMTPQGVSLIVKSPLFQEELQRRRGERDGGNDSLAALSIDRARRLMEEKAFDAANTHVKLLESNDERVAQKSASAILDRVFGKHDDRGVSVVIEAESVQLLQLALMESKGHSNGKESDVEDLPPNSGPSSVDRPADVSVGETGTISHDSPASA
jgi:hypothetical protein